MRSVLDVGELDLRGTKRRGAGAAETYADRALLQAVLPRFDAATQAVALGVIVEGMQQEQVAAGLGVSRRTVARKLTRFLRVARQHVAVAAAAVALAGCPVAARGATPPMRTSEPEPPRPPRAANAPDGDGRAESGGQADLGGERATQGGGEGGTQVGEERAAIVGEERAAKVGGARTVQHDPQDRSGLAEGVHALLAARMRRHDAATHRRLARAILAEAELASVDPLLVLALIHVESAFDPRAVSGAGAIGLMQLREPTMRREIARSGLRARDPRDPVANIQAGVRYLRRLIDAFGGVDVALMAYNAGPNRIRGHLRRGKLPERFHAYPRKVKGELERLRLALPAGARSASPLAAAEGPRQRPAG